MVTYIFPLLWCFLQYVVFPLWFYLGFLFLLSLANIFFQLCLIFEKTFLFNLFLVFYFISDLVISLLIFFLNLVYSCFCCLNCIFRLLFTAPHSFLLTCVYIAANNTAYYVFTYYFYLYLVTKI